MNMYPIDSADYRIGIHYFPDTLHYRQQDLLTWLPELNKLGAKWLTLLSPVERAVPESFLSGLIAANIRPILHFQLPIGPPMGSHALHLLFSNYARWGVDYVCLYDRPNVRKNWHPATWAQAELVERFLDLFIPLASAAVEEGLTPVFPPLEPGGDYWDLAFLSAALQGISRRGCSQILDRLHLGAYAWVGNHPLDWGAGGSDRWPEARPYIVPPGSQDHRGFRIFDWYLGISQRVLDKRLPIMLLRAGSVPAVSAPPNGSDPSTGDRENEIFYSQTNLEIVRQMEGDQEGVDPRVIIPAEVLCCNFWLLSTSANSNYVQQAWFHPDGHKTPAVEMIRTWLAGRHGNRMRPELAAPKEVNSPGVSAPVEIGATITSPSVADARLIDHYILLPLYAWGAAEWDLEAIQPILDGSHPTIGFSLAEARTAARVTVVGGDGAFSEETLNMLRSAGCVVERLQADGMLIAT